MTRQPRTIALAALALLLGLPAAAGEPPLGKLGFNPDALDADGLLGPPGGKRALDYEFCIPADERFAAEVRAIDPSARFQPGSRGRIGCGAGEVLVLGNTHQPGFAGVLARLVALPWVTRIEPAWFE